MLLTIFTPVYNRPELIKRTYRSLLRQAKGDFEWIVINDGSTDGGATARVLDEIAASHNVEEAGFDMRLLHTPNGGKHRAVNRGVNMARGEYFMILDSDDWLCDGAVASLTGVGGGKSLLSDIKGHSELMGVTGLRVAPDGVTIGTDFRPEKYSGKDYLDCSIDYYRNRLKVFGDRAEVIRTEVMREFPFPEIPDENFITEAVVWLPMGMKYLARFTADPLIFCDYQPGGLTATGSNLVESNPAGAALAAMTNLRCCKAMSLKDTFMFTARWIWRSRRAKAIGHPLPEGASIRNLPIKSWLMMPAAYLAACAFSLKRRVGR